MADKHVKVEISAVDRASQVFRGMGREADSLKKRLSGLRGGFGGLLSGMGAGALGALGGGLAFSSVIGQAADFESALYETTKVTSRSTEDIRRQMLSLPSSLGSVTELTTGYYQVLSAGISDVVKSQETLTTASKLAKVAGVSQAESIQALTKMMAGYRGELKSTAQAADLLLDIEEFGQASVRTLVPIIGDLAGVSQLASVQYKEMAAALSLLTQTAGDPARAGTQYRNLMMELLKPNEQMIKLISSVGAKSGAELIKKNGLIGALALLQKAAKASNAEMSKFIGSSEALTAFANLADNGFRRIIEILDQVGTKTGRTEESYRKWLETFRGVEDQGRATFSNLAVAFGEGFLPVVKEGLTDLNSFLEANTGKVAGWGRSAAESLTSVTKAVGGVVDLWQQVPDSLEYGLIGRLLFGKKGLLLGLMIEVADTLHTVEQGIKAFSDGTISFGEWATSNRAELKGLLKSRNWRETSSNDHEALSFAGGASQAGIWRGLKEREAAQLASAAQTQATALRGLIQGVLPSSSLTASDLPSAGSFTLEKPTLTLEHPVLDMGRDFAKELSAHIPNAPGGKSGPNLPELQPGFKPVSTGGKKKSGKSEAEKAAEQAWKASDALREMDLTIARLAGDSETVKRLELQDTIADWEKKFSDLKVPADVAREKIEQLTEASQKSTRIKDAQAAAQFYKELAEAAGDFGAAQEYTNQLIELQAENLRQSVGVSDELIAKWAELQKLQNSRDLFDGAKRGALRFADEYGDVAKQVENLTHGIGSTIATTLSDAFMTGEFSAQKFFTSLVSLASQAMANVLVGKLMGGIFDGVSLFHSGGVAGVSPATTRSVPAAAFALAPRFHNGGGLFASDEYPAILKRGERVLNPAETRAFHAGASMAGAGGSGGDVVLNVRPVLINETGTPMTAKASASYDGKGGFDIEILVTQVDTALARRDASGRSIFGNQMDKTRGLSRSRSLY